MKTCDSVQLAAINAQGYPRVCEMELLKSAGLSELFFTTLVQSAKVAHYGQNSRAGVSYSSGCDSVSLVGEVEVIHDPDVKKQLWTNGHERRFVNNADGTPKYCILKFRTIEAAVFIDGEKETFRCSGGG